MLVNAQIVLMRCKTNKKLSGIRIEQTENGSWKINWAFPIKELSENNLNIYTCLICSTYFQTVPNQKQPPYFSDCFFYFKVI